MNHKSSSDPKSHVTDRTSLNLLELVRENDSTAWQRLVDLYSPLVFSWCRRCNLNREDASDIMQEVFAKVAAKIADFRRDKKGNSFRGWLRTITRNQIRMHFRRIANRPQAVGGSSINARMQQFPEGDLDEQPDTINEERALLYQRALELIQVEFEEHTWRAFLQTTIDGRSSIDVAADLNMTCGAVRQAKYKVTRKLRLLLPDMLD